MSPRDSVGDEYEKVKQAFQGGHFSQVLNLLSNFNLETLSQEKKLEALSMMGIAYFETGDGEEALRKIKQALAIHPHYAMALDAYGDILQEQGKLHAAIAKYRAAIAADSALWEPYFHWGYLLKKMGSPKAALRKLQTAIEKNPDHTESQIHAGDCAFQLGRYEEALTHYEAGRKKGGESAELFTRIGNVYLNLGDRDKAMQAYEASIKADPMEGSGYENIGLILHQEGKFQDAERKIEEGLIHAPQSPTLLLRHGEILITLGKFKEALNPLLKALEFLLEKADGEWALHWASILADAAYMLGFAQRKLGDPLASKEYFLMALRYAPNHVDALGELAVLRGVYREHHVKWDFVLEGKIDSGKSKRTGLRAYRVAALTLDEALRYAKECEDQIQGNVKAKEVSHTEQVASYAGVLARGALFLIGRGSKK